MRKAKLLLPAACAVVFLGNTCTRDSRGATERASVDARDAADEHASVVVDDKALTDVYESGLKKGWQDYGWAPRTLDKGKPARVNVANYGGWIVKHKDDGPKASAVVMRVQAPSGSSEFLELSLGHETGGGFPPVKIEDRHRRTLDDGTEEIVIAMDELNPAQGPWDRVKLRAWRRLPETWLVIERLSLAEGGALNEQAVLRTKAPPKQVPTREAEMSVDCRADTTPIKPGIYGIAFSPRQDHEHPHLWELGATGRRWGGNPAERYNWKLGNAWNSASDWFFTNLNYTNDPDFTWKKFLDANQQRGVRTALTVPVLGWVARDTKSYSFSVKALGPQKHANDDAGNGVDVAGKPIAPGSPTRTSIKAGPRYVADWVRAISAYERERGKGPLVDTVFLGNEPMLWNTTHRDVHPEPTGYDELLERTLRYGTEVRKANPKARIAGPALWGWTAYFFSAKDAEAGFRKKPDRRAHGDTPLLEWYLQQLKRHEEKTGVRILDAVSVHYYPQSDVYNDKVDAETAARRIRSTRGLWDPRYVDESWIKEPARLIPRMQEIISDNYPGRDLIIGEYSFGGEQHMSGALAQAEALGRFGQLGVDEAYYWTYPPAGSPTFWSFRAYRNYDGKGARFLDEGLPTRAPKEMSLFASTDEERRKVVAIALNFDPETAAETSLSLLGCNEAAKVRAFSLSEAGPGFAETEVETDGAGVRAKLPPYSVNVIEVELAP